MGKVLLIQGADFSQNGIVTGEDFFYRKLTPEKTVYRGRVLPSDGTNVYFQRGAYRVYSIDPSKSYAWTGSSMQYVYGVLFFDAQPTDTSFGEKTASVPYTESFTTHIKEDIEITIPSNSKIAVVEYMLPTDEMIGDIDLTGKCELYEM